MLFAAVFFAAVFRATKAEREPQAEDDVIENRKPFGKKLMWISFMGFAVITLYYGPLIYRSAQAYEGRLSWYIDEAKHKRSVTELLFLSGLWAKYLEQAVYFIKSCDTLDVYQEWRLQNMGIWIKKH